MKITYDVPHTTTAPPIASVALTTHKVPLNAFEIELVYDPAYTVIEQLVWHDHLLESDFMTDIKIDNGVGRAHIHCGSHRPFVMGAESVPVIEVRYRNQSENAACLQLGSRSNFRIHDSLDRGNVITVG